MVKPKTLGRALAIGMLLSVLVTALTVHFAGGVVVLPTPWAPIPALILRLSFVIPLDVDPDDPGDGGGDGDGHGEDNQDGVKDPDIDVRVWHEDESKVRLLVTLAGAARTQFRERGEEWLGGVIRKAVRRSFADHPLHHPFRRTTHLERRPPRDPSEADFES